MKLLPLHPPVPSVIEKLEELLAEAKSGELQAVVVFTATSAQEVYTHWSGDMPFGHLLCAIELHKAKSFEKYLEAAGRLP